MICGYVDRKCGYEGSTVIHRLKYFFFSIIVYYRIMNIVPHAIQ